MSQFIEDLLRPHVLNTALDDGYRAMAADADRKAQEWWIKATAPMCSAALLALAAPGLLACRVCSITRKKMRSTMPSTAASRCIE
jgi:hypothetical protein